MNNELGTAMDKPSVLATQVMQVINDRSPLVDSSLRKQLPIIRRFAKHEI